MRSSDWDPIGSRPAAAKAAWEGETPVLKSEWPEGFPAYSKHNYILELFKGAGKGAELEDSVTLQYVTRVQMQAPHSLDRKWTLTRVYEQSSGIRERVFSISGRSGDQPLDITRFFKMRNFYEKYSNLKSRQESAYTNSKKYTLRINFTWEAESFEASILNFSYQREAGNTTNSYIWSMTLATNNMISGEKSPTENLKEGAAAAGRTVEEVAEKVDTPAANAGATESSSTAGEASDSLYSLVFDANGNVVSRDGGPSDSYGKGDGVAVAIYDKAGNLVHLSGRRSAVWLGQSDNAEMANAVLAYGRTIPPSHAIAIPSPSSRDEYYRNLMATASKAIRPSSPAPGGRSASTSWFDDLTAAVHAFESSYVHYSSKIASMRLEEVSVYRHYITPTVSAASSLSLATSAIVGSVVGLLPSWKRSALMTVDAITTAGANLKKAWDDLGQLTSPTYWENLLGGSSRTRGRQFSVLINNVSQRVIAHPAPSGNSGGGGTGTQDAYNLAFIFLGDRSRWLEIAEANSMSDPYTKADGTPLRVGDTILIPDEDVGTPVGINQDSLLGSDLMIKDGDLVMKGTSGLRIVTGEDNLSQSIAHRLKTVRGTNRAFPNFGLRSFLNEKQTSTLTAQVWSEIRIQLIADRRISDMLKILIDEEPSTYKVWLSMRLVSKTGLSAQFEYSPEI
jgi:hypothetical protein